MFRAWGWAPPRHSLVEGKSQIVPNRARGPGRIRDYSFSFRGTPWSQLCSDEISGFEIRRQQYLRDVKYMYLKAREKRVLVLDHR